MTPFNFGLNPLARAAMLPSSSWLPTDISGLIAWWDFSDISTLFKDVSRAIPVTSDGDVIAGVEDKSAAARHGSQSVTAKQPIYIENMQNGLSVARSDLDLLEFLNPVAYSDITIFMVMKGNDTKARYVFSLGDAGTAIIQNYTSGKIEWYSSPRTVIANSSTSVFQNVNTDVGASVATANWLLCGYPGQEVSADFGEVFVFDHILSVDDDTSINDYILSKWGV